MSSSFDEDASSCVPQNLSTPNSLPIAPPQMESKSLWSFQINMTLFILVYTLIGAYVFQSLELREEEDRVAFHRSLLITGRQKLLSAMAELQSEHGDAENKSKYLETIKVLEEYEGGIDIVFDGSHTLRSFLNSSELKLKWGSYLNVYYFVLTLLSTIGYGNIAPTTLWGRVFCVIYSIVGIPVLLIFIAQAGKIFAKIAISILAKMFGKNVGHAYFTAETTRNKKMVGTSISVTGVVALVFLYMSFGAMIVDFNEGWGFINSFYFCFITLTTVGFGDLVPLQGRLNDIPYLFLFLRSIYTLVGLAITSTAIALVQKHYEEIWKKKAEERENRATHAIEKILVLANESNLSRRKYPAKK